MLRGRTQRARTGLASLHQFAESPGQRYDTRMIRRILHSHRQGPPFRRIGRDDHFLPGESIPVFSSLVIHRDGDSDTHLQKARLGIDHMPSFADPHQGYCSAADQAYFCRCTVNDTQNGGDPGFGMKGAALFRERRGVSVAGASTIPD